MSQLVADSKTDPKAVSGQSREPQLLETLQQYWGYDSFRPKQLDAINAAMDNRDSIVIFPTGGGKSLCFQVPAILREGLAIVVSPLLSLMKDQVDALQVNGVAAACLNSTLSAAQERLVLEEISRGQLKLVYMSPERLLDSRTLSTLEAANVSFFAIDEAHCVSQWGHDFRPEYRKLAILKQRFPQASVHAFTATATPRVRKDIAVQLGLADPQVTIGSMFRSNLNYQVHRRSGGGQIIEALEQHKNESGIVYCISRKKVESTCKVLQGLGYSALPYHAGLDNQTRQQNQDAFLQDSAKIMVATVAFGMGIDKSNVRFVIHAEMPKSLEAYQQESGRAGRDGLPAKCWLFYNGSDFMTWKRIVSDTPSDDERKQAIDSLNQMSRFCDAVTCRHVSLAQHFGEDLTLENCEACDVCLNDVPLVDDPLVLAQKVISCVFRVDQRFGAEYVAQVLTGSTDARILQKGHDKVSTYGLLSEHSKKTVREWIDQLLGQKMLIKSGEYNVIKITDSGRQVLRGELVPKLRQPSDNSATKTSTRVSTDPWKGVDRVLFDQLCELRADFARQGDVPVHVVFSDNSIKDMAKKRPSTESAFRLILGVSQQKQTSYGDQFLAAIKSHCQATGVAMDVKPVATTSAKRKTVTASALEAFPLFAQGLSIEDVAEKIGKAVSTTGGYLDQYIVHNRVTDPSPWVNAATEKSIIAAIDKVGPRPLKPIFVELNEQVPYDQIRIVLSCIKARAKA